jgi:hypothetical protein
MALSENVKGFLQFLSHVFPYGKNPSQMDRQKCVRHMIALNMSKEDELYCMQAIGKWSHKRTKDFKEMQEIRAVHKTPK